MNWWADPNIIAWFAALGQWAGAAGTIVAVFVAVNGIRSSRKQFEEEWERHKSDAEEERQFQLRPMIVPIDTNLSLKDGKVDFDFFNLPPDGWNGSTSNQSHRITLQNMGEGVALNVHSFLYGPHPALDHQCGTWHNGPIPAKGSEVVYLAKEQATLGKQTKVDDIHWLYDDSDTNYRVARLTTTYHDIFGNKHVSIFDYSRTAPRNFRWMHIHTAKIKKDLEELEFERTPRSTKRKPIK